MKVEEIAEAVAKLPPDQLARFRRWFTAFEAGRTDHAEELDSTATKLGRLAGRAFAELKKRARRRYGTLPRPSTLPFWHPCHGDDVMDRNNRIGRRERFEILKIVQGLGEGVTAVDKGPLRPLRPNAILGGARRKHRSSQSRRSYLAGLPRPVLGWAPGR